jgi:hypothetical protein
MNASAGMMGAFQDGLLTLTKIRSGGRQTVVAGQVKAGAKRRKGGSWWGVI